MTEYRRYQAEKPVDKEKEKTTRVVQTPSLEELVRFEGISWPEEEQATPEQITQRLADFPEGIFLMYDGEAPVAQFTVAPKDIHRPEDIGSFTAMRDMPVDRQSRILWGINLACDPSRKGGGYASEIVAEVLAWADENGYEAFAAGLTCDDFDQALKAGEVTDIADYMYKRRNRALRTFQRSALKFNQRSGKDIAVFNSDPIADYWPEDQMSHGYGVLVEIDLPSKDYGRSPFFCSFEILETTSRAHYVAMVEDTLRQQAIEMHREAVAARLHFPLKMAGQFHDLYWKYKEAPLFELRRELDRTFQMLQEIELSPFVEPNQDMTPRNESEIARFYNRRAIFLHNLLVHLTKTRGADAVLPAEETKIEPTFDLHALNFLGAEARMTASGKEQTGFIVLPVRGCKMNCTFCSPKHLADPTVPLSAEFWEGKADEFDQMLEANPDLTTLKLFNAGNILWGSEFGEKAGAVHERFWQLLPEILRKHPNIRAVEIEMRTDEFSRDIANPEVQTLDRRRTVLERLVGLNDALRVAGVELRVLLAIEYASEIVGNQAWHGKGTALSDGATSFLNHAQIPWLGYVMYGGRTAERALTPEEAFLSTVATIRHIADKGGKEAIVNCQYLDPILQREAATGKEFYVPSKIAITTLLIRLESEELLEKIRVRITLGKEDLLQGTIGMEELHPEVDDKFKTYVDRFNNAPDQLEYVLNHFA